MKTFLIIATLVAHAHSQGWMGPPQGELAGMPPMMGPDVPGEWKPLPPSNMQGGNWAPQQGERSMGDPVPLQADFNASAYMGTWYDLYHTKGMPFQSDVATDVTATYVLNADGTVGVTNREWLPMENRWNVATAVASVIDPAQPAHFQVQFPNVPFPGDYRVLATDYTNIAIVYSQQALNGNLIKFAWVLARKTQVSDEVAAQVFSLIRERVDLAPTEFVRIPHGIAPPATTGKYSLFFHFN